MLPAVKAIFLFVCTCSPITLSPFDGADRAVEKHKAW